MPHIVHASGRVAYSRLIRFGGTGRHGDSDANDTGQAS